ncbi:chemotaxis protein, partial [Streptomyces scabiei]
MEPLTGAFAQLYEDFERMRVNVNSALAKVSETARNVGLGSSEIRQASDDLARRTEQQGASLEQASTAMTELAASVG